jgi:molybdopterin-biosynthesis enzyme MoeA-like protein
MTIPLSALLKRVAPETELIVEKTRHRFNQAVRQVLRAETRLQLNNLSSGDNGEEREVRAVRVFVTPGMPEELKPMQFEDSLWIAIELAPLRGALEMAQCAMNELSNPISQLMNNKEFAERYPESDYAIWSMHDLAAKLLEEAEKFDFLKRVFGVNEDVLGRYSFRRSQISSFAEDEPLPNVRVDLYWGVIGLVAKVLGVSVEALTVKVLAHELAHAYTHVGADADGKRWDANWFVDADRELKEGLAQYYTVRVLDRLDRQIPEAREAYEKLLPHQPKCYHTHVDWLIGYKPEEVRDAMLTVRRGPEGTLSEFNAALGVARKRLRKI